MGKGEVANWNCIDKDIYQTFKPFIYIFFEKNDWQMIENLKDMRSKITFALKVLLYWGKALRMEVVKRHFTDKKWTSTFNLYVREKYAQGVKFAVVKINVGKIYEAAESACIASRRLLQLKKK